MNSHKERAKSIYQVLTSSNLNEVNSCGNNMAATTQFRNLLAVGGLLVDSAGNACSFPDLPPDGVLGLYFTAQCFGDEFAPVLVDFYRKYGQRQPQTNRKFDIITVSLDDDEAAFDQLRATMPWPSMRSYDDQGTVNWLASIYCVCYRGIACLLLW